MPDTSNSNIPRSGVGTYAGLRLPGNTGWTTVSLANSHEVTASRIFGMKFGRLPHDFRVNLNILRTIPFSLSLLGS